MPMEARPRQVLKSPALTPPGGGATTVKKDRCSGLILARVGPICLKGVSDKRHIAAPAFGEGLSKP